MNKFRNASNRRLLKGLFFETLGADKPSCLYTLKDEDHEGYPSLYKLYMLEDDTTEYSFAQKHLDGWDHWVMLTSCGWFEPIVTRWRKELATRRASEAEAKIKQISQSGAKDALTAARYLLERAEKAVHAKNRGRPRRGSGDTTKTLYGLPEPEIDYSKDLARITKQ